MTNNPVPPRIPPRRPPAAAAPPPASVVVNRPVVAATPSAPAVVESGEAIVAKGAAEYRIRRYLMTILLIAGGIWFAYDGWKGWPRENQQIADLNNQLEIATKAGNTDEVDRINSNSLTHKTPRTPLDIRTQKLLAFALPLGGLLFLFWTLYSSRGSYRLQGNQLSVPGHPPVLLSEITDLDRSKWERKGIAFVHYQTAGGASGKFRLDDFVYQQDPTDEIYKRIQEKLG